MVEWVVRTGGELLQCGANDRWTASEVEYYENNT